LLAFGENVEVVGPTTLRDELAEVVVVVHRLHNDW
jgi:hypothetical protein